MTQGGKSTDAASAGNDLAHTEQRILTAESHIYHFPFNSVTARLVLTVGLSGVLKLLAGPPRMLIGCRVDHMRPFLSVQHCQDTLGRSCRDTGGCGACLQ